MGADTYLQRERKRSDHGEGGVEVHTFLRLGRSLRTRLASTLTVGIEEEDERTELAFRHE